MQQRVIVCLVARLVSNIKKNIYSFDQALDIRQDFLTWKRGVLKFPNRFTWSFF